jgi:cytochrome c peroxidase
LGQKLFFDGRLSADGTVACATCHDPARAFTDGRPVSIGIVGRAGQRNSPTVLNALYNKAQFWDGRVKTLEEQAKLPIVNPSEMGQPTLDAAVAGVAGIEEYGRAFRKAFGRPVNGADLVRAIAAYERTLVSFDAPFDHFIAGDQNAIDDSAKRGWELFNTKARCNKCHALTETKRDVTNFTDFDYHNIGIGIIRHNVAPLAIKAQREIDSGHLEAIDRAAIQTDMSVLGRFLITKKEADTAAFKTPNLRNVLVTGPYFHDGSQETLWDVMDHYNKGDGLKNPWLDEDIQPLAMTEQDIDDLVAFLAALTSPDYRDLGARELRHQLHAQDEVEELSIRATRSTRPVGPKDHFAKVGALEAGILERQHIIVDRTEGTVRPMLHTLVEGVDNAVLKVGAARMSRDNSLPLLGRELSIGDSKNIHIDTRGDERDLRLLVFRNAGRGMQRDRVPDDLDRGFRNVISAQEVAGRIRAIHLEAELRMAAGFSKPDVMKHGADVEQLGVVLQALALASQRAEQVHPRGMVEQKIRFRVANQLGQVTRHFAVRNFDAGDGIWHFRAPVSLNILRSILAISPQVTYRGRRAAPDIERYENLVLGNGTAGKYLKTRGRHPDERTAC